MTDDPGVHEPPNSSGSPPTASQPRIEARDSQQPEPEAAGQNPFRWEVALAESPDRRRDLVRLAGASLVAETTAQQVHAQAGQDPGGDPAHSEPEESRASRVARRVRIPAPQVNATARRAAQAGRDGLAGIRSGRTYIRAQQAGRTARDAAAPHLSKAGRNVSKAGRGAAQQIAANPELTESIVRNVTLTVMHAAAVYIPYGPPVINKAAPPLADRLAVAIRQRLTGSTRPATASADQHAADALEAAATEPGHTDLGEFADALGVSSLLDPSAFYRDGPGTYELRFPMPQNLASLPWNALDRKTRFCALFAAWAHREADGMRHLTSGQPSQARGIFTECLARAEQLQVAELMARSYEDLSQAAAAGNDTDAAQSWLNAAVRARNTAGHPETPDPNS